MSDFLSRSELAEIDSAGGLKPFQQLPSMRYARNVPPSRFPDFFCIGAQKAGTTWLYECLAKNPDIWMPPIKEIDHFSQLYIPKTCEWAIDQRLEKLKLSGFSSERQRDLFSGLGESDYSYGKMFSLAPPACRVGDISPEYMLLPIAGITHLYRPSPHSKVLLMVRDPVDRFWSHARHLAKSPTGITRSLIDRMLDSPYIIARSDYAGVIKRWCSIFDLRKIYIADFQRIIHDRTALLVDIFKFLEVDEQSAPAFGDNVVNQGFDFEIPEEWYLIIRKAMTPFILSFAELVPDIGLSWIKKHGVC